MPHTELKSSASTKWAVPLLNLRTLDVLLVGGISLEFLDGLQSLRDT